MHLIEEIRRLREAGLEADIRLVAGMLLQDPGCCAFDGSTLTGKMQKYEVMIYYADALFANAEYKRAEKVYKQALHLRLEIAFQIKSNKSKPINNPATTTSTTMLASNAPIPHSATTTGLSSRQTQHKQQSFPKSQSQQQQYHHQRNTAAPPPPPTSESTLKQNNNGGPTLASLPDCVSEVEVKYRLSRCYLAHHLNKEAILILETITNRKRGAKINISLATLYENSGQDRAAVQCYEQVLKEYPLALDAAQGLVRAGAKAVEINSILQTSLKEANSSAVTANAASSSNLAATAKSSKPSVQDVDNVSPSPPDCDPPFSLPPRSSPYFLSSYSEAAPQASNSSLEDGEWLSLWVKGQATLFSGDYGAATACFDSLTTKPALRNSVHVLVSLGQSQYLQGNYDAAKSTYEGVRCLDPFHLKGMDQLANLLFKAKLYKDLEMLGSSLMEANDQASEAWIAMGYVSRSQKKNKRAIYFAQKAYTLVPRNVEALILKGMALVDIKRVDDAIVHFREALRLSPKRFEAHHGLIGCYLTERRMREAVAQAKDAFSCLGQSARSLTLYGTVLAKEPLTVEKAKSYLERALRLDPLHTGAVYPLADIHASLGEFEKGAELLRKQLVLQSTGKLHQVLGDFLSQLKEYQEALDQYSIALSLDPSNSRALEGIQRVEKASDSTGSGGGGGGGGGVAVPVSSALRPGGSGGGTFDDMEALDSENEAELSDGPEATAGDWSDTDFS